jgi:zinc protease
MKRLAIITIVSCLAAFPLLGQSTAKTPTAPDAKSATKTQAAKPAWERIPIPDLREFHPQQPKRIELANGMIIFLQEDHELPLIDGLMLIRGGSREEPAEKVGLVSVYGQAWRTSGTTTRSGDQLDDFLEARAAKVETGGGQASVSLSWSALKGDFDEVFAATVELLRHPQFRDDKIALAKQQLNTGIARRNDDPMGIAAREANKLAYGSRSAYARTAEYATVDAITRADLEAWHAKYVQPNNIILGIVGDFDSAAMEARLRKEFESWPQGWQALRVPDVAVAPAKPGVYFIQKEDVNQSNIRMVGPGIRRDNPDYFALSVLNEVFAGGFSSRLISEIRTRLGLAYVVGGGVGSSYDHEGVSTFVVGTRSEATVQAIKALDQQLDELHTKPPTQAEVDRAKDTICNSFVFEYDTPDKVLSERINYEFYGYPPDFLDRFLTAVNKVTPADVERVAKKYVHKDQMSLLVVGNAPDFDKPLDSMGPVSNIDITIPGTPESASPAAASK